jgi:hypothetical protein
MTPLVTLPAAITTWTSHLTVNNDATTLTFTINLVGNPMNNNWYNFYVGISGNLFGGVGGNFNATLSPSLNPTLAR